MLRRFVIFIVALVHINGSMFLPQVAEVDIFNAQGQQEADVNTVVEYVDEIILGNHKSNPVDEDNDQGQNFHLVKIVDYYFALDIQLLKHKPVLAASKSKFPLFPEVKITPVTLDILAPPPKA